MSAYTCITCGVVFSDADLQRLHYKTDWHRYNLKRKVAELPPVTADNFEQRVLTQRAQDAEDEKDLSVGCTLCNKHFSTKNGFENHVKSKRHKEAAQKEKEKVEAKVKKLNEKNKLKGLEVLPDNEKRVTKDLANNALKRSLPTASGSKGSEKVAKQLPTSKKVAREEMEVSDDDSEDAWDDDALGIEECLFCSKISSSFEDNMKHMSLTHSFFIPDLEYLIDVEEFIQYLGEKIGVGHVCLWCSDKGKAFHSTKSVQQHMLDKGHCKILHESDAVFEYVDFYDYRSSYPDNSARDEQNASGAVGGDIEMLDENDDEEEIDIEQLKSDGYEMVLPSGATIGHRSLMRYYRQNLPHREHELAKKSILPRMLAQYKALGWTGATGEVALKRVKDLGYMQRMKSRYHTQLGIKNNKLQKHFRKQVMV